MIDGRAVSEIVLDRNWKGQRVIVSHKVMVGKNCIDVRKWVKYGDGWIPRNGIMLECDGWHDVVKAVNELLLSIEGTNVSKE